MLAEKLRRSSRPLEQVEGASNFETPGIRPGDGKKGFIRG